MASEFPSGWFFIRNVASGKVLDVDGGNTDPGAKIILWNRKQSDYDNQLWKYEDGFIINKNSGLVMEVPGYQGGGDIAPDTGLVQAERRDPPESLNQLWAYNIQHIMPYDPKVCVWGKDGDVSTPGTMAVIDKFIMHEVTQEWMFDIP